jgi:hypothetical protein
MSNPDKTPEELEQYSAVFNIAPLTDDIGFSYIIEVKQAEGTEYCGVSCIEEAFNAIQEWPFSTATINLGNKIPSIKFN